MPIPKYPTVGDCIQFIRTTPNANVLTAGRVVKLDPEPPSGFFRVDYFCEEKGEVIRDARISIFDLVSDEDVAVQDFDDII